MPSAAHPALYSRRIARLVVMWLLAVVLPLQGTAAVVFAAMGPSHVHRASSAPPPVLEDFRRWKPVAQRSEHAFAALGHFHTGGESKRHHHARDDASVVTSATDVSDADEAAAPAVMSVLAMIPSACAWACPDQVCIAVPSSPEAPQTRCVSPPDRPPRKTA